MESESIPGKTKETTLKGLAGLAGRQAKRHTAELQEARGIAETLGLPAEQQYAIRSALHGDGSSPAGTLEETANESMQTHSENTKQESEHSSEERK